MQGTLAGPWLEALGKGVSTARQGREGKIQLLTCVLMCNNSKQKRDAHHMNSQLAENQILSLFTNCGRITID